MFYPFSIQCKLDLFRALVCVVWYVSKMFAFSIIHFYSNKTTVKTKELPFHLQCGKVAMMTLVLHQNVATSRKSSPTLFVLKSTSIDALQGIKVRDLMGLLLKKSY